MKRGILLHPLLATLLALAGCSVERHTYLADDLSGTVVKIPESWAVIDAETVFDVAARNAPDLDTLVLSRWVRGFSATQSIAPDQLFTGTSSGPGGVVRSRHLLNREVDTNGITVAALLAQVNDLALLPNGARLVSRGVDDGVVTDSGVNGIDTELTFLTDEGEVVLRYVIVVDVTKGQVNSLTIGCSKACFEAHEDVISKIADSFTDVQRQ